MISQSVVSVVACESRVRFQPIVDARTYSVLGFELVAASPKTTPEVQAPQGVIDLDDWLYALTCLQSCRTQGCNVSLVAHVSAKQLHSPIFIEQLMRSLAHLRIPASCIELVISESIVMGNADSIIGCLTVLRQYGFSIVLDKLGCSYSTFSRWLDMPLTGIRIDEELTLRAQSSRDPALIEALFKIASIRGLHTLAAGVHHADAAAVLTLLGVHRLQGNFFGAAMSYRSFMQLLGGGHVHNNAPVASP